MKKWMRVDLYCGILIICIGASLVFAGEGKETKQVAGIWIIDKDKMQQESEKILELARVKAKELKIESAEEQLKRLKDSHKKSIERTGRFMSHFNEDGSGGVFPSLAGFKGMRGQYSGAISLLLWKAEGKEVSITQYSPPFGYSKARESTLLFEGDNLVVQTENPARKIKPDETNLQILFDLERFYFRKVDSDDIAAQKPRVLSKKGVQLEAPGGFETLGMDYTTGIPESKLSYINQSDQKEKIKLTFTGAYGLARYNRPGGEKATHDEVIAILTKGMLDKLMEDFPEAKVSTDTEILDGIKAGYVGGLLDENHKDTKGPLFTKQYVLVDDGIGVLNIVISAGSAERIKFMDDYVKNIKLNMTKTWVVTMEEVMEAKRKTEEYMKEKSSK